MAEMNRKETQEEEEENWDEENLDFPIPGANIPRRNDEVDEQYCEVFLQGYQILLDNLNHPPPEGGCIDSRDVPGKIGID